MRKRRLSLVLALVLALSMSFGSFASETDGLSEEDQIVEEQETEDTEEETSEEETESEEEISEEEAESEEEISEEETETEEETSEEGTEDTEGETGEEKSEDTEEGTTEEAGETEEETEGESESEDTEEGTTEETGGTEEETSEEETESEEETGEETESEEEAEAEEASSDNVSVTSLTITSSTADGVTTYTAVGTTAASTSVTLTWTEGTFAETVSAVTAEDVDTETAKRYVQEAVGDGVTVLDAVAVDITFLSGDEEIEPVDGRSVAVALSYSALETSASGSTDYYVVHVPDNEEPELLGEDCIITSTESSVTFTASEFTTYASGSSNGDDDSEDDDSAETTDDYDGDLYHIDIVVNGTFTYTYNRTAEEGTPILSVTKSWTDEGSVDHSGDSVTVYLLDEDREYITDSNGNYKTITLNESNNWTTTFEDTDGVYYVEEESVNGYDASYTYTTHSSGDTTTESYTTTGTIKVTSVNSVEYTYTSIYNSSTQTTTSSNGTFSIPASMYIEQEDAYRTSTTYSQEFFCGDNEGTNSSKNNAVRRLGLGNSYTENGTTTTYNAVLNGDSTIYINVTYTYEYVDETGTTQTGTNTSTFTFDAGRDNACAQVISYLKNNAYPDGGYTMLGYDAILSAEQFTVAMNEYLTYCDVEIENSPSSSSGSSNSSNSSSGSSGSSSASTGTGTVATGAIAVVKVDAQTGEYLSGASFTVYNQNEGTYIGTFTTDENGYFSVGPLTLNYTYVITEVSAPDGYILDGTAHSVTLTNAMSSSSSSPYVLTISNTAESSVLDAARDDGDGLIETETGEAETDVGEVLSTGRGYGTGDDSNLLVWILLLIAAGTGLGAAVIYFRFIPKSRRRF